MSSREAILQAAQHLMTETGYEKTSIAMICQRAGLPVGSLYHHFGSKAALLAEVVERGSERFWAEFEAPTTPPEGTIEDRLRWFCDVTVQAVTKHRWHLWLVNEAYSTREPEDAFAAMMIQRAVSSRERLTRFLEACLSLPGAVFPVVAARRIAEVVLFTRGVTIEKADDLAHTAAVYDDLYFVLRPAVLVALS